MLRLDRSIHPANRLWIQHERGPPIRSDGDDPGLFRHAPTCSEHLIPQTGFGRNTNEALRSSRRATIRPLPSCSDLIGASHPASRLWIQHGGGPPIKSEGDEPASSVMLRLDRGIHSANRLWTPLKPSGLQVQNTLLVNDSHLH